MRGEIKVRKGKNRQTDAPHGPSDSTKSEIGATEVKLSILASQWGLRAICLLLYVFPSVCLINSSLAGTVYPDLPIHAFNVADSKISIFVDREIIVPSLTGVKLSDANIAEIMPYKGSAQAEEIQETLTSLQGITLGHMLPYIYIAVNNALDRIFQNRLIADRELEPELRALGFQESDKSKLFANLREVIKAEGIKGAKMNLAVYTVRENFEKAAEILNLHSAQAFWSPDQKLLGLYIDGDNFRWLPFQADSAGQTVKDTVFKVRDYIARLVISLMGHETFHFVQSLMQYPPYSKPFFAEAAAVAIEDNISFREEMGRVSGEHRRRGLPLIPRGGSACELLTKQRSPFGANTMRRIERGVRSSAGMFDLEKALLMGDAEFYGQAKSELQTHYDLSAAFVLFAAAMSREEFSQRFAAIISGQTDVEQRKAISGLNEKFATWLNEFALKYWADKDADHLYTQVKQLVSYCMGAQDYVSALLGTRLMAALRPRGVTPLVYAGDIFYRLDIPFFALDYYVLALAQGKDGYLDEPEIRVISRLGDAFESLGDLKGALGMFQKSKEIQTEPLDAEALLVVLRSKLKAKFYDIVIRRGQGPNIETKSLMDSYVKILQLGGCPTPEEKEMIRTLNQILSINQVELFKAGLEAHYIALADRMTRDLDAGSIPEILDRQRERCR
jgi:hypothetical protein